MSPAEVARLAAAKGLVGMVLTAVQLGHDGALLMAFDVPRSRAVAPRFWAEVMADPEGNGAGSAARLRRQHQGAHRHRGRPVMARVQIATAATARATRYRREQTEHGWTCEPDGEIVGELILEVDADAVFLQKARAALTSKRGVTVMLGGAIRVIAKNRRHEITGRVAAVLPRQACENCGGHGVLTKAAHQPREGWSGEGMSCPSCGATVPKGMA